MIIHLVLLFGMGSVEERKPQPFVEQVVPRRVSGNCMTPSVTWPGSAVGLGTRSDLQLKHFPIFVLLTPDNHCPATDILLILFHL